MNKRKSHRLDRDEFAKRRQALMSQMEPNSIAIIASAPEQRRNRDVDFPFRQDSDFYYLSGFAEPESVIALIPGREHGEYVVFCRERNREMEIWNGYRAGPEGATNEYGADDAFPINDIDDILPGLIEGKSRVYYAMGREAAFDSRLMSWINVIRSKVRNGAHPPGEFSSLDHILHEMRLLKSAPEAAVMRASGEIAAKAHCQAMRICRPGMYEYQLEAEYLHVFAQNGARFPAYPSIVGGGQNACILHYTENSARLQDGDLVLIDAGCELDFYASDITRTFPVNGRFTSEQKVLYELVLSAQLAAIESVRPGAHWNEPHERAVRVLTEGLVDLGLLRGEVEQLIKDEGYKKFYMHKTGHWIGMDVHDVGEYKIGGEWRLLEPGMVLTIEPGLYISNDLDDVDERWKGIGIRIEDDVLVTKEGYEVLTSAVPKRPDEIEALMAEQ